MAKTVINVLGMSCEHCVKAVTGAVSGLPGVTGVLVSLENNTVTLDYEPGGMPLDMELIIGEIKDQGFDVVA
ncbi:MAG: cation transporter [Clostridiales Family XIII bacterium]|jgi:copper chaperone|nr:cation transporter [Clostridiales Family XIII bacterium]